MDFNRFRQIRRAEIMGAMDLLWAMRHTMPVHSYNSMLWELKEELAEVDDNKVIQFRHLQLLRDSLKYYNK